MMMSRSMENRNRAEIRALSFWMLDLESPSASSWSMICCKSSMVMRRTFYRLGLRLCPMPPGGRRRRRGPAGIFPAAPEVIDLLEGVVDDLGGRGGVGAAPLVQRGLGVAGLGVVG